MWWLFCLSLASGDAGSPPATVVIVSTSPDDRAFHTAVQALHDHLSDLPLEVVAVTDLDWGAQDRQDAARRLIDRHHAAVVMWFEKDAHGISLGVIDARDGQVHLRRLGASPGKDRFESAALIASSTLRALLGKKDEPPPKPEPVPVLSAAPASIWSLAFAFDATLTGDGQTMGARATLAADVAPGLSLFGGARLLWPIRVEADDLAVRLRRYPVELGVMVAKTAGPARIGLAASLVIDVVNRRVTTSSPDLRPSAGRVRISAGVDPLLFVELELGHDVSLLFAGGAEIFLDRARLLVDGPEGAEIVHTTEGVLPRIVLGFVVKI